MQPNNGQTNPLLYSDPIPGGEAFPNERLENGEIQNPYYNEGFENLSDDDKEVRDESETKRSGNDAVAQQFNQQWDADKSINLENVKQAVEGNYADGAIEQSVTSTSAQADISEAERNAKDIPDADTPQQGDQPHDAAEATAKLAIHTSEIGEKAAEAARTGAADAKDLISQVNEYAAKTESLADATSATIGYNADTNTEKKLASSTVSQAREMAEKAVREANEAQAEYEMQNEEEKAITQAAAEAAEEKGTDFKAEKDRISEALQEREDEEQNSVFGE